MPRRTLARRNLLTFSAQPWNLFEDDPGAGGGGGGGGTGPTLNEHGYPDATPVADMTSEHQVAYWKHHARKHEAAAKSAPDSSELERLRAAEAELNSRKAAELSDTERLQKERDDAAALAAANAAKAEAATAELLKLKVAGEKKLTPAQAAWLKGSTQEELEASADQLLADFGPTSTDDGAGSGAPRSGGPRGGDVGGSKTTTSGAERYRQRHGK
ncbi:hypothetical protein ACFQ8W_00510 [Streptomyces sp. NPDC056508]|uniref:hypothetical protein n=1 Tax=Streptomyces sp. NPDC056508 TaxID=3345845 RepID=UPI00369E3D0C